MRPNIDTLRAQGIEVKVSHLRPADLATAPPGVPVKVYTHLTRHELRERGLKPAPKGGVTYALIKVNGKPFMAHASCSRADNFNRRRGRDIAIGRALKRAREAGEFAVRREL